MTRLIVFVLFGSALIVQSDPRFHYQSDALYYASLNEAIQLGQYDGVVSADELKLHGNFGLGSEEKLASELVLLDGVAYGIPADGRVRTIPGHARIAFAATKFFSSEQHVVINKTLSMEQTQALLDSVLTRNAFAAIRIKGKFASIKYRSYEAQEQPYKPISRVPEKLFTKTMQQGTIVGFYTPKAAQVLNSPVYHFHFINTAKTTGGHVHDFILTHAEIDIDYTTELTTKLANPILLQNIDLND